MKTLSINELSEQEKGPIWVINTSNNIFKSGADVHVTFMNNGQSQVMTIPRTWLPIELTSRFPRKVIMGSSYFMDALSEGLLGAISAEAAANLLKQSGAQREMQRLAEAEEAVRASSAARGIGKNVRVSSGNPEQDEQDEDKGEKRAEAFVKKVGSVAFDDADEGEDEGNEVSANFKAWVEKVNAIEDSDDAFNEVRMYGALEMQEAQYLHKKCTHQNIVSKLAKKLGLTGD